MLTYVNSSIWQRRTNKIVATAVVIIGLTMMISTIPICIYAGLAFVVTALSWLGYMRMKERKAEPPRPPELPHGTTSPVLFLVPSYPSSQTPRGPTLADPNDKPPTYDQIIKLDGLPPDYITVLKEKPPRYEDIEIICSGTCFNKASQSGIPAEMYHPTVAQVHTSRGDSSSSSGRSHRSVSSTSSITSLASINQAIADVTGFSFFGASRSSSQRLEDMKEAQPKLEEDGKEESKSKFEETASPISDAANVRPEFEGTPEIRDPESCAKDESYL